MNVRSALIGLTGTVLAFAAAAGPASAATAAPAASAAGARAAALDSCTFVLEAVTSDRLQERADEIRVVIDGQNFPSRVPRYVVFDRAEQTRLAAAFGSPQAGFTGQLAVSLKEVDLGTDDLGTHLVPCSPADGEQLVFDNQGARYRMTYSVTVD